MMARIHHKLPDDFNPADDICYPLVIPKDDQWIAVLLDLLEDPLLHRYWLPEPDRLTEDMRTAYYQRVYSPLITAILTNDYCSAGVEELGSCYRMDTTTEAFSFYPNDPFVNETFKPILSGLKFVRWRDEEVEGSKVWEAIEDALGFISGYRSNDVLLFPDVAAFNTNIVTDFASWVNLFSSFPFPYVEVEFTGTGQLEVELLNFPFGGAALLIPDRPSNIGDVVSTIVDFFDGDGTLPAAWLLTELDRDLDPPVPELVVTQVQEFEFTSAGDHTITILFLPDISIAPPAIGLFGGIREIEFCGDIQVIGQQTGTLYDEIRVADDTVFRKGLIAAMTSQEVCEGVLCAFEEMSSRILLAMNSQNIRGSVDVSKETDGTTTITLEETVKQLFEDVPDFPANDEIYGGLLIVEERMTELAGEIVEGHTEGLSAQQVADYLFLRYDLVSEQKTIDVVNAYYLRLNTADPVFTDFTGFASFSFCETQSRSDLQAFVYDTINSLDTQVVIDALLLAGLITFEQFNIWMDKGKKLPNNGYESSPCYLLPTQTKILQASDMFVQGGGQATERQELFDQYPSQAANERYAIRGSGYFTQISTGRRFNINWHQDTQDNYISNDTRAIREKTASADVYPDPVNRADGNLTGYYTRSTAGWVGGLLFVNTPTWDLDDVSGSITIELINLGSA